MSGWLYKRYEKSELTVALIWIGGYCLFNSFATALPQQWGVNTIATLLVNVALTAALLFWIHTHKLWAKYGLCRGSGSFAQFLWYIPLVVFVSHNLWGGVTAPPFTADAVCYVLSMLCVGFLEEVIFRGLLFKALAKENVTMAMVVSSVTFGLGHILNLFNGSGMTWIANLSQVVGAIACGFLFVIILHRGGSLIPCVVAHGLNNAVYIFADAEAVSPEKQLVITLVSMAVVVAYAVFLLRTLPTDTLPCRRNRPSLSGIWRRNGQYTSIELTGNREEPLAAEEEDA